MTSSRYILAIDQGTTSTRAFLIDQDFNITSKSQKEFRQHYPKPGLVEHDPEEIWSSTVAVINETIINGGINAKDIAGIGITNQRETTVIWDRTTGKAIHNAIVWQDRRTDIICKDLIDKGLEPTFIERSGLVLDPYFSGTKIKWLLDNIAGANNLAKKGELAFGTIDSYLVWRLSGGVAHVTDASNASRTLCMNLETCKWDAELMKHLGIPLAIMPEIIDSSKIAGTTKDVAGLPDGLPVAAMIGDQQAALFGQACFDDGDCKCTYGTGSFLLMNTGEQLVHSKESLLSTVAWKMNDHPTYAIEASVFTTGAAVQWLRDGLGIIKHSSDIEALAASVDSSHGVVFVPALAGLGAPHWNANARGQITGITRGTTAAHIARATLEGIALQVADVIHAMTKDSGKNISELKVDGGASANNLLMQIQSDIMGIDIIRPKQIETTVMGAAFLAGLNTGVWKSRTEIASKLEESRRFKPKMDRAKCESLLSHWRNAIEHIV